MASQDDDSRLTFQEAMDLIPLPPKADGESTQRAYMGTRAAWLPGFGRPVLSWAPGKSYEVAYGGHVYCQAALATCRARAEDEEKRGTSGKERLGLHSIHGYFTAPGRVDRPFIYDVSAMSSSRVFSTYSVAAHQPSVPSSNPSGDHFPPEDASELPAGPTCFAAITSFKQPEADSGGANAAEDPPSRRFGAILSSRRPHEWPPSPPVDIDAVVAMAGPDIVGTFPALDMRKVDMTSHNQGRPLHERRELLLYRLLAPLPSDGSGDGAGGGWDANSHILVHAFAADKNGLLMLGNQLGFGFSFGRAASLSYSFVVHVNAEDAVFRPDDPGWWVQEVCFPRAAAGRGIIMSKIWSPRGVHVATEYQDGLCRTYEDREGPRTEKL